ncbi:MAG: hypothetical protein K0R54_2264 [Clostridiaceae bacterium]|jgi:hypothetical protein|nr:hypothetical protein [Clostridiaceae bacterium]
MDENWCAFYIAIMTNSTVEQAFTRWKGVNDYNNSISQDDVRDMIEMKKTMTYKQIGEIYGITDGAVNKRIKRFKGAS